MTDLKLGIIVPYREREQHMAQFIPHVSAYFARDKIDRNISYRVLFVEQSKQYPFNRGILKNIGFQLLEDETDYVCFHDIDYLPIWSDYSPVAGPTAIVWYGAESRPVAPGRSQARVTHNLDDFYGGAVMVNNDDFRHVNGYANDYWGWGLEDLDLKSRFDAAGIPWQRRKGTYLALDHDNEGFELTGQPKRIFKVNREIFASRYLRKTAEPGPGLESLRYNLITRSDISPPPPEGNAKWEIAQVRLLSKPLNKQLSALKNS